jgi:hypothetical protein
MVRWACCCMQPWLQALYHLHIVQCGSACSAFQKCTKGLHNCGSVLYVQYV